MDKLIINTNATADYSNVIRAFIRAGFSVNQFTINNDLLIVEISSYHGLRVSKCDYSIIAQSIYEIATVLGIDNITMQHDDAVAEIIENRVKHDELAKCYAIVQAEELAADIAFNIHFTGCKKRIYQIDSQSDTVTLCKCLEQFGVKSYIVSNTRNLVIA